MEWNKIYILLEVATHLRGLPGHGNLLLLVQTELQEYERLAQLEGAELNKARVAKQHEANVAEQKKLEAVQEKDTSKELPQDKKDAVAQTSEKPVTVEDRRE